MTVFLALSIIILFVVLEHFFRLRNHKWLESFNGPSWTLPVFGDALQFLGHFSTTGAKYRSNFREFGQTWKFWFMTRPSLVTCDPHLIQQLLKSNDHLEKHFIYENVKLIFGNYGLVTSNVHQWKIDRRIWNKTFNVDFFERSFNVSVRQWKRTSEMIAGTFGERSNCSIIYRKHFLATLLNAYVTDANCFSKEQINKLSDTFTVALEMLNMRMTKPWTGISLFWKLSGNKEKFNRVHSYLRSFFDELVSNLPEKEKSKSTSGASNTDELQTGKYTGFSAASLFSNPDLAWDWKYDHFINIAAAGIDTSAITATMTLFFLALNPKCQRKAQEEVDSLFDSKEKLEFTDLPRLKYLRMCIKEALRLHPSVPLFGRTTSADIFLQNGFKIPKGTAILVITQAMNLNPKYFSNPLVFDPERFNEANLPSMEPYSYIPFSVGPRNCIGQKYTEYVIPTLLALTLRKFSVQTLQKAEDIEILYEIAGSPYPDVEIIFKQREH